MPEMPSHTGSWGWDNGCVCRTGTTLFPNGRCRKCPDGHSFEAFSTTNFDEVLDSSTCQACTDGTFSTGIPGEGCKTRPIGKRPTKDQTGCKTGPTGLTTFVIGDDFRLTSKYVVSQTNCLLERSGEHLMTDNSWLAGLSVHQIHLKKSLTVMGSGCLAQPGLSLCIRHLVVIPVNARDDFQAMALEGCCVIVFAPIICNCSFSRMGMVLGADVRVIVSGTWDFSKVFLSCYVLMALKSCTEGFKKMKNLRDVRLGPQGRLFLSETCTDCVLGF